MQKATSTSHKYIPLRSPTPPLHSSSEDLNDVELQELQHLDDNDTKKPHFLDEAIPPPDFNTKLLVTSDVNDDKLRSNLAQYASLDSSTRIPLKNAHENSNSVSMSYVYEQKNNGIDQNEPYKLKYESPYTLEQMKLKKAKEPSYALSRYLTTNDDLIDRVEREEISPNEEDDHLNEKTSGTFSLLSLIGCHNSADAASKFLEMSKSSHTCRALRQSRCIPLLVEMIHFGDDETVRSQSRIALKNVVNNHADDKTGRRDAKVLRYIEQIMEYCDLLSKQLRGQLLNVPTEGDNHPLQAVSTLMRISFDEEHRHAMSQLGALQAIASLVHLDHAVHSQDDPKCISLHRYAFSALTNLTFGDGNSKAFLCGNKDFMKALVAKVNINNDGLLVATANVIRNLSWRPDNSIKAALKEIGTVTALTCAAMKNHNENPLRAILSALWNLSAHCSSNKEELCLVDGALAFLVDMLTYDEPNTKQPLLIIENAGGILNNVSSHIAVNEQFRRILRQKNCLSILLQQLDSESLTVVGNACGTLWNLSARCSEDQKFLRDNGAVPKLRLLIHSTHKMISEGSLAALKNLINFRPNEMNRRNLDSVSRMIRLKELPSLNIRKQRAAEQEREAEKPSLDMESKSNEKEVSLSSIHVYMNEGASSRQTGTIPKRIPVERAANESQMCQWNAQNANTSNKVGAKHTDSEDQITNFSLLYDENTQEPKEKSDAFVEDSVKLYDVEGTPQTFLSNAGSDDNIPGSLNNSNPIKHYKSNHPTAQYSGGNTPEKPIYYCEEGTPMYFSHQDSFNSLTEEAAKDESDEVTTTVLHGHAIEVEARKDQENCTENEETVDTAPVSPEGAAAKSVKFNEFLETPMMFSRQSSMESLSSIEPTIPDDQGSVVSEISRMTSGIISPSELPDSPSQTMPQSPRRRRTEVTRENVAHFEDEVKTFGVENTPAHISCATSLSNLSIDDEPKITTDSLIKEMRLMHQLSDEQDSNEAGPSDQLLMQNNRRGSGASNAETDEQPHDDPETEVSSVSGDSVNDSMLLASCISIGMKNGVRAQSIEDDHIKLPPLPVNRPRREENLSSDDDDIENADDDFLIQKCIQDGMQAMMRTSQTETKPLICNSKPIFRENPIGMFRGGGNTFIETAADETSPFQVEDSPCNFSVVSGLSDLTIGSNKVGITKSERPQTVSANNERSLSPISVTSEDDQRVLDQAIAAGINRIVNAENVPVLNLNQIHSASIESLSSSGSNDSNDEKLLQQCIQFGIQKVTNPNATSSSTQNINSVKKTITNRNNECNVRESRNENISDDSFSSLGSNDSKDEQLLQECIEIGKRKTIQSSAQKTNSDVDAIKSKIPSISGNAISKPLRNRKPLPTNQCDIINQNGIKNIVEHNLRSNDENGSPKQNFVRSNSKNERATSVSALVNVGASNKVSGVVKSIQPKGTNIKSVRAFDQRHLVVNEKLSTVPMNHGILDDQCIDALEDKIEHQAAVLDEIGYKNCPSDMLNASFSSVKSINNNTALLLERSNEYPAGKLGDSFISETNSVGEMDVSNEFLYENLSTNKMDKHKDPDLMLRSVERLTHDFVSTAEYLRTASVYEEENRKNDSANNTWNDNSNSNDCSFPSISRTAPIIASTNDDNIDGGCVSEKEKLPLIESNSSVSGEQFSTGKDENEFEFDIGGETNRFSVVNERFNFNGNNSYSSYETISTTMTNSTIITMEANKIRNGLLNFDNNTDSDGDSIISLDKIQPPSVMEALQFSSLSEKHSLNGFLNKTPIKGLTQGFMARRALNGNASSVHNSMDSINSLTNLDRVNPPSLMDELLDSMMSVDSINSELIEVTLKNEDQFQHDKTMSEYDEMTMTLVNCIDLPMDDTSCSELESSENTPKRTNRSLTPKRKRQLNKDRFQTYTIATDGDDSQRTIAPSINEPYIEVDITNRNFIVIDGNENASFDSSDNETYSIKSPTKPIEVNTNTFTRKTAKEMSAEKGKKKIEDKTFSPALPKLKLAKPAVKSTVSSQEAIVPNISEEAKIIRGRKKPAYVSPYNMKRLAQSTVKPINPPVIKFSTAATKKSPIVTPNKTSPITKQLSNETKEEKSPSKTKSFIQRSAESFRKIRPNFTTKTSKSISPPSASTSKTPKILERQKSDTKQSTEHLLIRQNTFTKSEPSDGEIPVITSEPASPRKISKFVSKIPFNRSVSANAQSTIQKSNTNIEILSPRRSATIRRSIQSASSASNVASTSTASKQSSRSDQKLNESKNIFKQFAPISKQSPSFLSKLYSNKTSAGSVEPIANKNKSKVIPKPAQLKSNIGLSNRISSQTKK